MQNKINYINSSFDEQIAYSKDDLKSQTTIFFLEDIAQAWMELRQLL